MYLYQICNCFILEKSLMASPAFLSPAFSISKADGKEALSDFNLAIASLTSLAFNSSSRVHSLGSTLSPPIH